MYLINRLWYPITPKDPQISRCEAPQVRYVEEDHGVEALIPGLQPQLASHTVKLQRRIGSVIKT